MQPLHRHRWERALKALWLPPHVARAPRGRGTRPSGTWLLLQASWIKKDWTAHMAPRLR